MPLDTNRSIQTGGRPNLGTEKIAVEPGQRGSAAAGQHEAKAVLLVRGLDGGDFAQWKPLFEQYRVFYQREVTDQISERVWAHLTEDDRLFALGAFAGQALVGITHYTFHASSTTADVCYLQDLITAEAARRQGVATRLIEEVRNRAEEHGCSRLYWNTHVSNETARRLYDRVGTYRGFIRYEVDLAIRR